MPNTAYGKRIVESALFERLKARAARYVGNPHELQELLRRAAQKTQGLGSDGPLRELWQSLMTLLRLLRAYARGDYRQVPLPKMLLIVASVLYLLTPIDIIPDFIVGLGYVDDAAVLAWVLGVVGTELDAFRAWEAARTDAAGGETGR